MKTRYFAAAVACVMLAFTSCVNDLDTIPLNDNDITSEVVYGAEEEAYIQGLAKLYATISSEELVNVSANDAGASQVTRAFWACQEITADACKCAWGNDGWVRTMNYNTWSDAENDAVFGVFFRSLQAISYCNEYLRQTASGKLSDRGVSAELAAKIQEFRAEARVIRAWYYWMAMDVFGAVPFATENTPFGADAPPQQPAAYIYDYIVSELEAVAAEDSALPAAQANYPRMDKGAALGLLARVYLNAETYKGEPAYAEAKATCERIFTLGYKLATEYADLFRGDNGENPDARGEFLMAVPFDTNKQQSNGGTTFLCRAAWADTDYQAEGPLLGVNGGWAGIRVHEDYVARYFNIDVENADFTTGEYAAKDGAELDKRGKLFFIKGRKGGSMNSHAEVIDFQYGWSVFKFNNIPHGKDMEEYRETALSENFTNIDLPIVRLGEIYLIYAEVCARLGQDVNKAQEKMNELSKRTGLPAITVPGAWNTDARDLFLAERARELMWESCRRTDLIRYGLYTSAEYTWPFKGNESAVGQAFPDYKKLFAIPASQIAANPDLKNPEGY